MQKYYTCVTLTQRKAGLTYNQAIREQNNPKSAFYLCNII